MSEDWIERLGEWESNGVLAFSLTIAGYSLSAFCIANSKFEGFLVFFLLGTACFIGGLWQFLNDRNHWRDSP